MTGGCPTSVLRNVPKLLRSGRVHMAPRVLEQASRVRPAPRKTRTGRR
jgi:hypothetical protein